MPRELSGVGSEALTGVAGSRGAPEVSEGMAASREASEVGVAKP